MPHVLAQDLRNAVLQAAIQGKLTEQLPTDQPVCLLMDQIKAEKNILIKEKKIKKDKPLTAISDDEIPFEIPETWKWVRFGEITSKLTDGSHNPPPNAGKGYPVISAKNLKNGTITFENVERYVDKAGFDKENPRTNIKAGDIILGIIGGSIGNIGVYQSEKKVIAQRSIAIIDTMINQQYSLVLLQSPLIQNSMRLAASGSAQGGVYLGVISNFYIPLPPIEEQARIAARVDELMAKIDEYEKIEKELVELQKRFPGNMKDAVLQAAMQGKLTEQLESDGDAFELLKHLSRVKTIKSKTKEDTQGELPYEVPESWAAPKLGEVFDIIMGSSPKGEEISNDQTKGVEFHQGKIAFTDELIGQSGLYTTNKSKVVPMNSALLCVRAPIGKVNITDRPISIGRGLCSITPVGNVPLRFILYVLRVLEKTFVDKGTGSTFKAITADVVLNQRIPLPPLEEQQRIVDKLDQLLPLCESLEKMV